MQVDTKKDISHADSLWRKNGESFVQEKKIEHKTKKKT